MADEKKVEAPPQAPAQVAPEPKKEAAPVVEQPKTVEATKPSGLDNFTADQLKEFYKRSPQMFEEAGIVKKEVPPEVKKEAPPAKPQSAAPVVMDGQEVKLPEDVQVNREVIDRYIAHAKDIGLTHKQVQAEIDFQVSTARDALKRQQKVQTPQEIDTANVAKLKSDFGDKYEANMEIARRAAAKYGEAELLERLKTSDPVLVKHFLKLGKADAEDTTPVGGKGRNGQEGSDEEQAQRDQNRKRFPNTPQMFKD